MNTSGRTRAGRHGDSLQVRISNQFSSKPDEGLSKVVVCFGRNVIVLKILLSAEDNGLCLNLSVLNIHFVATQHDQDVLTHSYQISMPVRHIVVSNSRCYISRPAVSHTLNLIGLLGMEQKRMDLNTQGSYIFLKFASQMTFQECSFSSTTITNQYKFEQNLGFSLGSHREASPHPSD